MKINTRISVLIIVLSSLGVPHAFANPDTTPTNQNSQELQQLTQSLGEKEKFKSAVQQGFDQYILARDNMMLSLCTQKLSEYQNVTLSKNFDAQMKQDSTNLETARNALFKTLKEAQSHFGQEFTEETNKFMEFDQQNPVPKKDEITRGYCLNYQKGFDKKIADNLKKYQAQTPQSETTTTQENALYLNSNNQLKNITFKLDQKATPTVLFINGKEYPIQCTYQDTQQYDKALAEDNSIKSPAYKASRYFYNKISPQIDYIITCISEKPLPKTSKLVMGDTYPWYQPTVTGSDGTPAAGDSVVDLDNKQMTVILGHEPCVCNSNTEPHCNKVKEVSREFKTKTWKLITSLEAEKSKHNAEAQAAIDSFISYTKNEIKKDFCLVDREGIINKLSESLDTIKKVEPNGIKQK